MNHFPTYILLFVGSVVSGVLGSVEIVSANLFEYEIPRSRTFRTAKGSSSVTPGIFVRIEAKDEDGNMFESWGDALPRINVTNESRDDAWRGAQAFALIVAGKEFEGSDLAADVAAVDAWLEELRAEAARQKLTVSRPPGPGRELRATLAGFDMALLGLLGEIHDLPLYEVLGGTGTRSITISGLTANAGIPPEKGRERVLSAHEDHRCVRLKIGTDAVGDLYLLKAVTQAVLANRPDLEIFVDVNQAWGDATNSLIQLARIRELLADEGFRGRFICEQPTSEDDFEGLAAVTATVQEWGRHDDFRILIMADEILWDRGDLEKLVALDAVDQVNFKIQKAGGLLETMRMARLLAEEKPEWEIYVGGLLMTDIGATANLHLGLALPRLDYITGALPRRMEIVNPATRPLLYQTGTRTLVNPTGKGMGTRVNVDTLGPYLGRTHSVEANRLD